MGHRVEQSGADAAPARAPRSVWSRLAEGLLLAYLLTLPAGILMPEWVRPPILYGVIAAGVLDAATARARHRLLGLIPVGIFLAVHALSIATSGHPRLSIQLSVFLPVVVMVFVVAQRVLVTRAAVDRLFLCLGMIAAVIAFDGACRQVFLWSPLSFGTVRPTGRIAASLPHPNDLVLVPILLPFAWEWLRARGWVWLVAGAVVLAPAVVVSLVASQSRNAWLTMGGVIGVWVLLLLGWRAALGAVVGLGLCIGGVLALDLFGVRARAGDFLRLSRDGRVGVWLVAIAMFRESPWLGKGVFTFGEYYTPSWFASRVRFPEGYVPERMIIPWAHNLVLELLSERGLVGLASFLLMVGSALASVRRRLADPRVVAAVASLSGFLGASMLDLTLMKDWVALMLFLLLALLWRLGADGDGSGAGVAAGESKNVTTPTGVGAAAGGKLDVSGSADAEPRVGV